MSALRAAFQALRRTEQAEEPQIPPAWPEYLDMPPISEPEPDNHHDFKPNTRWGKSEPLRTAIADSVPQSIEAEKGVLSSIMQAALFGDDTARKVMFLAEQQIGDNHFFQPAHKAIWQAMKHLHQDNDPLDFITIGNDLQNAGQLETVGGSQFINEVSNFVPTHANIDHYLGILKEKRAARLIIELADRIKSEILNPGGDIGLIIENAQEQIKAIQISKTLGKLPELDDMSQIIGDNLPKPPDELVKGILHQGSKMIIGGVSKGRKTWSLIDLGVSVATGSDWWGCPTIKGKVCYINFEIQRPFFAKRFQEVCRKKGVTVEPGMFKCWTLRGFSEGIEKMAADLLKMLIQDNYVLIIFDPIYKALGDRDENKAGDVASMLNELEAISVKTGSAIAFGAHYSKGNQAGKDAMDRIGGSGVFARDPDSILTMTTHEQEESYTVDCSLRNFPPQPPFVVQWEWPLFTRDDTANAEDIKQPKKTNAKDGKFEEQFTNDDFLELLHKNNVGRTPTEFKCLSMTQLLCSESTFKRYWRKLKTSPFIEEKNGRFYTTSFYSPPIKK